MWGVEGERAAVANAGNHVLILFAKAKVSAMTGECYVDRQQILGCVVEASFPSVGW